MPKVGRQHKDRSKRKPHISKQPKRYAIVRSEGPQKERKIVVRKELVKDPETGKAVYKDIYDIKDIAVKDNKKVLYIPKKMKPKEFKYLREEPPQFREAKFSFANPFEKYGDLNQYKKNTLIKIAKEQYGLKEGMAIKMDKEDVIKFMRDRWKGKNIKESNFLKHKFKLGGVEPERNKEISYYTDVDGKFVFKYGKKSYKADDPLRPKFEQINEKILANPKHKNIPLLGTTRPFDENLWIAFNEGRADKRDIASELMMHLKMDEDEKLKLPFYKDKTLFQLYKKAYKQSLKDDSTKFTEPFYLPSMHLQPSPGFSNPPYIKDELGKKWTVGTTSYPKALNPFRPFDYTTERQNAKLINVPQPPPLPPQQAPQQAPQQKAPQNVPPLPKYTGLKEYKNLEMTEQQLKALKTKKKSKLPYIEHDISQFEKDIAIKEADISIMKQNLEDAKALLANKQNVVLTKNKTKKLKDIINDNPIKIQQEEANLIKLYDALGDVRHVKFKQESKISKIREALKK
jgi:hypothetical protein